ALLVIASLENEALEDYSMRVVESWKLGSAKRDDGLLMLIAVAERRARIEVGHGLEGAITDALSARVLRGTLGPALAAGVPDDGVRESFEILMREAEQESTGPVRSRAPVAFSLLVWIALAFLALNLERARQRALGGRGRARRRVWVEPAGWGGGF